MPLGNRRDFFRTSAALAAVVGCSTNVSSLMGGGGRVAIVARGRSGDRMAKLFLTHPNATVTAVAGVRVHDQSLRTSGNWKSAAKRWLSDSSVSAVAVSVPGRWPLQYAFAALECGKDVYLDPLRGYAFADLAELEAVAREHGRVVYVALPHRANPGLREAIDSVQNGAIGSVRSAHAVCLRAIGDESDPFGSAGWSSRVVRAADLAVWALGDTQPTRVFAAGFSTRPLPAAALPESSVVTFAHGATTLVLEQSAVPGPLPDGMAVGAIIEGTAGRLVCRDTEAVMMAPDGTVMRRFRGAFDPVGEFFRVVANRGRNAPIWSGLAAIQFAASVYRDAEVILGPSSAALPTIAAALVSSLLLRAKSAGLTPSELRSGTRALS